MHIRRTSPELICPCKTLEARLKWKPPPRFTRCPHKYASPCPLTLNKVTCSDPAYRVCKPRALKCRWATLVTRIRRIINKGETRALLLLNHLGTKARTCRRLECKWHDSPTCCSVPDRSEFFYSFQLRNGNLLCRAVAADLLREPAGTVNQKTENWTLRYSTSECFTRADRRGSKMEPCGAPREAKSTLLVEEAAVAVFRPPKQWETVKRTNKSAPLRF